MKKVMRMVKIKKAEYVLSAAWKSQWPEESFPEMCLAGRSNVGKSSFINAMLNHNGLAKVSGTPGKTRTLNFLMSMMHYILLMFLVMVMLKLMIVLLSNLVRQWMNT